MGERVEMVGNRELPGLEKVRARRGERSDAAESRRKVLAAARTLFEERGVDGVSMHEIGRAAGVGQGTLYRRYGHKGLLCAALLRERVEEFSEEVRGRAEEEPALDHLGWLLDRLARFNEENAPLLGAIRGAADAGRRVEMHDNYFYRWLRSVVSALLLRAVDEGKATPELDVECLADFVLAALNIDLYLYQREELGMDRERVVGALHSLVLDGVRGDRLR